MILDFINSNTIRKYLENQNYQFDLIEAAWIISQSRNKSYEEKKAEWEKLIDNMPDCPIPDRMELLSMKSMHDYIRTYISVTD